MKKIITSLSTLLILSSSLFAQNLSGYDIMKKADNVSNPKTSSFTATLTLKDKKGNIRVREIQSYEKNYTDVEKSIIVFKTPKDVAGVGYLNFSYEKNAQVKKDNDSWLYMPALKKERRISGTGKGENFMGTDFTYDDIDGKDIDDDTYSLLQEEVVAGFNCYKVECLSKDQSVKNPRRIVWVRKDNFVILQCEFYDRQNMLQRFLSCEQIENINNYWTTKKMTMTNVQTNHSTVLQMSNINYDINLEDSLFTVSALIRGIK